ncbi:hypothetical protein BGZ57DRAFT_986552 [Hyaloscypha finlandica]|nr:hypothetical protein BGZ57DRAFT_986552 [Hyaloscypha finlandica]KAH8801065.1 hypothetical protein F5882DRAFT_374059 [Hyaloscypha sp. PMI_1271]
MRIFDDLFFSGSLTRRKPHRGTALFVRPLTKVGLLGRTTTEGSYPDIYAENIITSISVPLDGSRRARQAEYRQRLGTLLHEMLHAYFEIRYYCTCGNFSDGLRRACCSGIERIGVTEHGQCWLLAALALEDFAEAELKFKFELGRAHTWEEEVAHTKTGVRCTVLANGHEEVGKRD